jgi:hypothetical protein
MFAFPFPSSDTITKELRTFMEYYSVERHQSSYFTHLAGGADCCAINRMRIVFNANRTLMVGTKRKKEILVAVPNSSTSNKNNNNINLTLYEFGSRQTVLTIAIK